FVILPEVNAEKFPELPSEELEESLKKIPGAETFAVRSSAADEDGAGYSFAGQFDSFLYVSPEEVADRVTVVWQSGFSERVKAYRREHGIDATPQVPAVVVQRMIDPEVSGVAFGVDPVSGRWDIAVVAAVWGAGTSLVSGEADSDTYQVDRRGIVIDR